MVGDRRACAGLVLVTVLASGCRLIDAAADRDDAAAADAAGCAPVSLLSDDFEDGVVDPAWTTYSDPGATLAEADGVLRVSYSGAADAWAGYATTLPQDLRGGALGAEIAQVGGFTILELNSGDTKVQTYGHDGTLFGVVIAAGDTLSEFETDYLPGTHAHWRMREEAGWIHWETSADGVEWDEMDARPTPLIAESVRFLVSGGGVNGDAPAEFESVDIAVAGADCQAASL